MSLRPLLSLAVVTGVVAGCSAGPCPSAPVSSPAAPSAKPAIRPAANLRLLDWKPTSMLVTKSTEVERPAHPVIDVHNHLYRLRDRGRDISETLRVMDEAGVRTVVNLDGGSGALLIEQLEKFDRAHPCRFVTFAQVDWTGFGTRGWTDRARAQLAKDFDAGAKGLKIHKNLGLELRDPATNALVMPDDPRLDPIWALCGERNKPVMIHSGDPAAFFTPVDEHNERWHELQENPGWAFVGKDYPSRNALLEARNRVIARHPKTTFIGAHMANNPEDLAAVGSWLDRYPNLVIDIDARISELGRQPYTARRFFLRYQDRILFGIDTYPSLVAYRTYYRFLETDDEYFDPGKGFNQQGTWMVYGLYLPQDVLKKVYHDNAARLLGGAVVCDP